MLIKLRNSLQLKRKRLRKNNSMVKGREIFDIVKLGQLKREINFKNILQWNSKIFKVNSIREIYNIPNFQNPIGWQYLQDDIVRTAIKHNGDTITVAITEYELEDNFYMRRVAKRLTVISLYEIGDILQNYNIPIENFIIKNIYEMAVLTHLYPNLPNTRDEIPNIIHDETRGCLFDMNGKKIDIIHSTGKLIICPQCAALLQQKDLPQNFVYNLTSEIKKIRKQLFYRISDFIKKHPLWSIVIGITTQLLIGTIAGLLANYFFYGFDK